MKLIFLGAPGAGKGTQAENVQQKLNIPAISTGNILKEAVRNQTPLGLQAKGFMDAGQLVPDELIIGIIKERLSRADCEKGFILDGVPRTVAQAEALDAMGVTIDRVVNIEVPDETIIVRMAGRRACPSCGATYHLDFKPPAVEGICDKCGTALIQRSDDHPDTVKERLKVYHIQTQPLEDYYGKKGILTTVVGQQELSDTTRLTFKALGISE